MRTPAKPQSRRRFLTQTTLAAGGLGLIVANPSSAWAAPSPVIQTVLDPVSAERLGFTLVHEHVMCDFIGAEQTNRSRWDVATVVRVMKPYLQALCERKVSTFIDCTPASIGRDPRVLKQLAQDTGLHIVTNTGYYGGAGDKFVPRHAYTETADQLADRWVKEFETGIEDTGVKPGFIKTGVDEATGDPARLSDIDAKLIRAAARTSRRTGLTAACHTGGGPAGLAATELFIAEGADPARFIVAHADGHGGEINRRIATLGAWVSFDALGYQSLAAHLKYILPMLSQHTDRMLLSMDSGWYWVGETGGGKIRDYNYLTDTFLPALEKEGIAPAVIRRLTVDNPARAFGLIPR